MRPGVLFLFALFMGASAGALVGTLPVPLVREPLPAEVTAPSEALPAATPVPTSVPVTDVPFRVEESLAPNAMACDVPRGTCLAPLGMSHRVFPIAPARNLANLRLELSWTPTAPTTQELRMDVIACSDVCSVEGGYEVVSGAEGESPLTLRLDALPTEGTLLLVVSAPDLAPGPGAARAHLRQEFVLAGVAGVLVDETMGRNG